MNQETQIFENEEATKLLDYYSAYKKLQNKIEYFKCIAALNTDINININPTQTIDQPLNQIELDQPAINLQQIMDQ